MPKILRYGTEEQRSVIYTPLDPLEDLSNLLSGLRSSEFVGSVLKKKHSLSAKDAVRLARPIGHHAAKAVGFLHQAYAGPPDLSFLPIYYALLSLSKIYILCHFGKDGDGAGRHHGASVATDQNGEPLDSRISIRSGGVFPMFYRALTDTEPMWQSISVGELLPLVPCLESELEMTLEGATSLCNLSIDIDEANEGRFELRIRIFTEHGIASLASELAVLEGCELAEEDTTPSRRTYIGPPLEGRSVDEVTSDLLRGVRRELLYYRPAPFFANMMTSTPAHRDFAVPEEIPLWLLFFWLSNVVRYSPEQLEELQDSRLWPILLTLRKHATLRFLILFWSYFHKTSFGVKAGTM